MKKSLLALAVAGAVAVPYTQAAEVTISGIAQINLYLSEETEKGDVDSVGTKKETQSNGANVNADDIRLNVGVSEDVGFGTGFANVRFDLDNLSGQGLSDVDEVRVGLKGGFGTVTLGEGPDVAEYGQMANDILIGNPNEPNTALSYEIPAFAPGLSAGVNFIADVIDNDEDGNENNDEVTGVAFGAKYDADLGDAGSLSIGAGTSSVNVQDRTNDTGNGSLIDTSSSDETYTSIGVKYSIAGVYLALAQQSVDAESENAAGVKSEDETVVSTDIQLGYSSGPVSAAVTHSTLEGARGIAGSTQAKDADDESTQATRLDLGYNLSDNVALKLRTETKSDELDTSGSKDSSASFTRVSLAVSF